MFCRFGRAGLGVLLRGHSASSEDAGIVLALSPAMKANRLVAIGLCAALASCATLGGLGIVQVPRIHSVDDNRAQLRFFGPSARNPYGGLALRVFARVENPNPFGVTLSTLRGSLFLEDQAAAEVDLPLGLALRARQDTVVPIDLQVGLDNVPGLARTLARAVVGSSVPYRLDGTVGVDAGDFGKPVFGPLTVLEGEVRVR